MKAQQAQLQTNLSVKECAGLFQQAAPTARSKAAKAAGVVGKLMGNRDGGFFTPQNTSPFAKLDDDPADFEVGYFVPNGQTTFSIQMYVWDRESLREVQLVCAHSLGAGHIPKQLVSNVTKAFRQADPSCVAHV